MAGPKAEEEGLQLEMGELGRPECTHYEDEARQMHKTEHAGDLSSRALVGITVRPADAGDTTTIRETLEEAQSASRQISERRIEELAADPGIAQL